LISALPNKALQLTGHDAVWLGLVASGIGLGRRRGGFPRAGS